MAAPSSEAGLLLSRPGLEAAAVQRGQPSQGLHRHLLSGRGSPAPCAAGFPRGARSCRQRVRRRDAAAARSPARGQVERGRGGGRAGPAPGVGPGGAGPHYANVAHGRPIAGAPRAAPSARPAGGRRETRASKRASERTAAVGIPERRAGPGRAGEREAARRGSRPGQPSASAAPQPSAPRPRPAPRAGECARSAPARGCPQPTRGEAAPSAPESSHGPGWGPGLRLLTRSQPRNLSAGPRRPPRLRRSGERARAGPWPRGAASAAGPTGSPGSAAAEEVSSQPGLPPGPQAPPTMPVAGLLLWASLLTGAWPATPNQDHLPATPRVRLSFKELKATGTAHFFNFLLNTTDYRILLKDEDHDRMYVGSKDYVLSLDLHDINREPLIIHWAASPQRIEECVLSGKDGNGECGNFVRLIQPWNRTHLYVCGTGAYNPMCTYVNRGRRAQAAPWTPMQAVRGRGSRATDGTFRPTPAAPRQDYIFYLEPERLESGKGKCPYDPKLDTASALINEELYAGVYIDFMGTDAAIFRTLGKQTAMRTDQYNSRWLNDPSFIHAELVPDSAERNDDKLYFFFRERSAEAPQSPAVYARIGRICLNDDGGHCCLVNKWSTFLKARLVCSVPGEDGIETHFDELQGVFVQQTQDVRNPVIYAVFTSSGSVFRGSAVCVYSMADIRMVFNGPFAHKEGPNYQWVPYSGKMPYPRPGTCPGGTFTPSMKSTKDYPDDVINFMRSHPLMYQAVYPLQRRPLVVRTGAPYRFTTIAVDQVDAADGRYEVLFLGTDHGTVQKVIVLPKDDQEMEELMLEEVEVFKEPVPVKTMTISSKRQQLYVASAVGVTHLSLHRCQAYGAACADCCLARDPYCAWDGQTCSRYTASSKRRSRRQDIRHGNPTRQCRGFNSNANKNAVESVQYGVAGSAAFLECQPRSPQAAVKWLFQRDASDRRREIRTEDRFLRTEQGLLLRALQPGDRGLYSCTATENNFKHVVTRVQLHVLGRDAVHAALFPPLPVSAPPPPGTGAPTPPYQELAQLLAQPEVGLIHQYCQGYWRHVPPSPREAPGAPRPPEPQDQKKPRNRRHRPPDT